jgi:RNA polymerase sigma-70 factor (ECF subfamily)
MHQNDTDLALITAVLAGQTSQYEVLVKRHQRFVFTLAMRFAKNREDAEEIAQDCFVKAYRALATFKQTAKFSTWLYTITYTTSMTFLRKKKLTTQSINDDENFMQIANSGTDFDANLVEKKSAHAHLNHAISMLLPDDAAIITLFYKGEQSLEEIAQTLNMEAQTVKVKLFRARLRLKDKLTHLLKDEVKELI